MYNFANAAYTTLIVAFIYSTYFVSAIAPDKIYGTVLWSGGVTPPALLASSSLHIRIRASLARPEVLWRACF